MIKTFYLIIFLLSALLILPSFTTSAQAKNSSDIKSSKCLTNNEYSSYKKEYKYSTKEAKKKVRACAKEIKAQVKEKGLIDTILSYLKFAILGVIGFVFFMYFVLDDD